MTASEPEPDHSPSGSSWVMSMAMYRRDVLPAGVFEQLQQLHAAGRVTGAHVPQDGQVLLQRHWHLHASSSHSYRAMTMWHVDVWRAADSACQALRK